MTSTDNAVLIAVIENVGSAGDLQSVMNKGTFVIEYAV